MIQKLIEKISFQWSLFWYSRKLKDKLVYRHNKREIYLHIDPDEGLLKVFISGLLFRMPLDTEIKNQDDVEKLLDTVEELNLENAYTEDLEEMLHFYEKESNYEKCAEIRDILNNRDNYEQTNKPSGNL